MQQRCVCRREANMVDKEEIVENTKATMAMENLPLPKESVRRLEAYLGGKRTLDQSVKDLMAKYKVA